MTSKYYIEAEPAKEADEYVSRKSVIAGYVTGLFVGILSTSMVSSWLFGTQLPSGFSTVQMIVSIALCIVFAGFILKKD